MRSRTVVGLATVACLAAVAFGCCPEHWKKKPLPHESGDEAPLLELTPGESEPIGSVTVGDAAEVALLIQQLELDAVRREGAHLIYVRQPEVDARLAELGYEIEEKNPYQVYRRVVRVDRRGEEADLAAAGVRLINREEGYWVVDGALSALRGLAADGYRVRPLARELRPREIRVRVSGPDDVQRVVTFGVDAFNVDPVEQSAGYYGEDAANQRGAEAPGYVLYGTAFDAQIDRLEAAGFEVERIDTTPKGGDR